MTTATPMDALFRTLIATAADGIIVIDVRGTIQVYNDACERGLTLQEELVNRRAGIPVIIITGHGDVPLAVRAMRAGAIDFIEKPFDDDLLLKSIERALQTGKQSRSQASLAEDATARVGQLTERERQVLERLVAGQPNKIIAYELDISPRTVEIHRAHVMEKMQARTLSDVVRLALAAGVNPPPSKA
jgi:two-component system, LuxR family, response regulator FixJ